MSPTETRSYYLPEDVAAQIESRTPPGWSASAVLTRIVRRYAFLMDVSTPDFSADEWRKLATAEFGSTDKHGYGIDSVHRLPAALHLKVGKLNDAERMAIWDHLVSLAHEEEQASRSRGPKKGAKR